MVETFYKLVSDVWWPKREAMAHGFGPSLTYNYHYKNRVALLICIFFTGVLHLLFFLFLTYHVYILRTVLTIVIHIIHKIHTILSTYISIQYTYVETYTCTTTVHPIHLLPTQTDSTVSTPSPLVSLLSLQSVIIHHHPPSTTFFRLRSSPTNLPDYPTPNGRRRKNSPPPPLLPPTRPLFLPPEPPSTLFPIGPIPPNPLHHHPIHHESKPHRRREPTPPRPRRLRDPRLPPLRQALCFPQEQVVRVMPMEGSAKCRRS